MGRQIPQGAGHQRQQKGPQRLDLEDRRPQTPPWEIPTPVLSGKSKSTPACPQSPRSVDQDRVQYSGPQRRVTDHALVRQHPRRRPLGRPTSHRSTTSYRALETDHNTGRRPHHSLSTASRSTTTTTAPQACERPKEETSWGRSSDRSLGTN